MIFNYRYAGNSSVTSGPSGVGMRFVPDTFREPTFFVGQLNKHLPFREAISALHDVVISDMRYKAKDRDAYKAWVARQEPIWLAESMTRVGEAKAAVEAKKQELAGIRSQMTHAMRPYYNAQRRYFDYLYKKDYDAWMVFDPVITVHPDNLFFECFSQDESSYGKLSCNYEVFKNINEFECGTTNIDYSWTLYNEFQKIRNYKETELKVDPRGFEVQTGEDESFRELKIDLPSSWVRGFLQVSSAMTVPARTFDLHPMDVHNFLFVLRRHKAKASPRSIRFFLKPGEPVRAVFEPWGIAVVCSRSIYQGEADEIRIWGRRRLLILERLLPIAKKFTVTLLGTGMPSFFVADLGDMSFTLGLSGWSANDWSRMGNFDLMAPRMEVDAKTQQQIYTTLKKTWRASADELAKSMGLDRSVILGALGTFKQAGRAIYDMDNGLWRIRELSREALPMDELRFANPREAEARKLFDNGMVDRNKIYTDHNANGISVTGEVNDPSGTYTPTIVIDADERMVNPVCQCNFYQQNKLFKGPCMHMLALRMAFGG